MRPKYLLACSLTLWGEWVGQFFFWPIFLCKVYVRFWRGNKFSKLWPLVWLHRNIMNWNEAKILTGLLTYKLGWVSGPGFFLSDFYFSRSIRGFEVEISFPNSNHRLACTKASLIWIETKILTGMLAHPMVTKQFKRRPKNVLACLLTLLGE